MSRPSSLAATALALFSPVLADAGVGDPIQLRMSTRLIDRSDRIEITADRAEVAPGEVSEFAGNVQVRRLDRTINADRVLYDGATGRLSAEGNVGYADPELEIDGSLARFETGEATGSFVSAAFRLPRRPARGEALEISTPDDDTVVLRDVSYTTCPEGNNDWLLLAPEIRLDRAAGKGVGRGVKLRFKGVPVLYAPYISFPISDQRKSGILAPEIGSSDRSGTEVSLPVYWNMAPNYDAVFTPRLLTRRGAQLSTDFRYLWPRSSGSFGFDWLPDDDVAGITRTHTSLLHSSRFAERWRFDADVQHVSDDDYFEDLGRSLGAASPAYLERRGELLYRARSWTLLARAQGFQTLADTIAEESRPYERIPQVLASGTWTDLRGLDLDLRGELVNFQRRTGVTGLRLNLLPQVSLPVAGPGYTITPSIGVAHTQYQLDDLPEDADDTPASTVPIVKLDGRAVFEREAGDGRYTQTLEPRMQYVHVPFRDQDDQPVFDSGRPDFNIVQLFRPNRFTGADRFGDTDQLSIGVTSRVFDDFNGREYLRATFGQTYFLSDREVSLPDEAPPTADASNFVAEVGMDLSKRWNADVGYQWDPENTRSARGEVRLQFRPDDERVVNLRYRYRRAELEQSDVSFAWPLSGRWNLVGRWNYSLLDSQTLERFAGVEYETCCWVARVVSRNFINDSEGNSETALFTQFEFKGLTSVGSRADALLENGILGYARN